MRCIHPDSRVPACHRPTRLIHMIMLLSACLVLSSGLVPLPTSHQSARVPHLMRRATLAPAAVPRVVAGGARCVATAEAVTATTRRSAASAPSVEVADDAATRRILRTLKGSSVLLRILPMLAHLDQ